MQDRVHRFSSALLISDLHLHAATPNTLAAFLRLCAGAARNVQALYVLGDLFEAHVGDDDLESGVNRTVVAALRGVRDAGVAVFVMHGNRDFLLGAGFCALTGAQMLADPVVHELAGVACLLSHGDAWCTDDAAYQSFRLTVRGAAWQSEFLAKPLLERRAIAVGLREQSEHAKAGKSMTIMDVNSEALVTAAVAAGVNTLIHGHTHRPAVHHANGLTRYVLSDWDFDGPDPRGNALLADATGLQFVDLD
jgi:UDP-2,3-diacylglucosamine hydrolase